MALDLLRGLAIGGILVVNVDLFRGPALFTGFAVDAAGGADRVVATLMLWLFQGKFVSAFSFLFGLGLALQAARAEAAGRSGRRLLLRRLAGLALIGAVHALLVWSGDILLTYALVGLLIVPFRGRAPSTCLIWAAVVLALPAVLLGAVAAFLLAVPEANAGVTGAGSADAAAAVAAYTSGDYPAMVAQRVRETGVVLASLPANGCLVLGMALLGAAAARAGLVTSLAVRRPLVRRVAAVGLGLGLPLNALYAAGVLADPRGTTAVGLAALGAWFLLAPLLSLGYLAAGTLVALAVPAHPLVRHIAAVGRTALSNYLLQSVLCTALFIGLGWYGRTGLAAAVVVAAGVYAVNVLVSRLWLARRRQGPVEALWRRLTYGRTAVDTP